MKGSHSNVWVKLRLSALSCLLFASVNTLAANPTPPTKNANTSATSNILQNYLNQERKAAGLVSHSVQIGNVTWSYSEGGSRNKPAILLIHGLGGTRDNWNGVAHFLTPYYHVIIPDLPANGDTRVPADFDVSVPNVTEQLRQFVVKIDIEDKLNIAGHSLGGSIATVYASQYPFDTQSLFLVNSAGIYKQANTSYTRDPYLLKNLIVSKPGDLDDVMHKLMQNPPNVPRSLKQAQENVLIARSPQTSKMIDQVVTLNRIYTPETFARLTRTVEAPTLILWGKQDKIFNVEVASELKSLLKRAEAPVILNNVGHMPILEAEQEVADHYLPFLAKSQKFKNPLADKLIQLN
ncbi:alpha/beta hydrolase [Acinetobacter sp. ANC 5054]|uniref:alpha/beta fold hydrolase n=1 Tax=Acinetobacter sp. ANC 5054 TaxID=1977877 RepID=UPI000A356435|nr:alpha/beta hydrolase [Acinetobacter sp. ANC 5054]OTG79962.1 alpha/beta hydrolase [Acinetobacter sp. ANC 5054]